ncbi:MAG: Asp-tRNA(Asn)/Glu-tRNA(Gln) amidotransferase subunit GatB [Candidatus Coatesbacteria bacterium]|nr:MAG: Asp-tRNA(Asn)/Glu-tRNA(Gln) amidotransferase subunit GatB [Candidatus Coatesbacteria bacterium]
MTSAAAYEATIGLEVHVQLRTASKLFCGCANEFGAPPNTLTCPVCLGHPGSLPVLNGEAILLGLRAAAALDCSLPAMIRFDRKNYFYPDLPKGFQISQHSGAVGLDGAVEYWDEEGGGTVAVERVHLEEDTAKAVHAEAYVRPGETLLDFNRSGVPLMEVVSRPVITSPEMARRYIVAVRQTLIDVGVSDCGLEKGAFRIDTNISVKPKGEAKLGEQVEIKNLNSIRAMEAALEYEFERQREILAGGGKVERVTLHYDDATGETTPTRFKEVRADYRYFAEPDLPPVALPASYVEKVRADDFAPPAARIRELREGYDTTLAEAEMLAFAPAYYDFLGRAAAAYGGERRAVVNWLVGDVTRELKERGEELADAKLTPEGLASLLKLLDAGEVNVPGAREVLAALMNEGGDPAALLEAKGLGQISDAGALEELVRAAAAANPKAVADLRAGKERARGALVGYVMKETKGRANPQIVNELITKVIAAGD